MTNQKRTKKFEFGNERFGGSYTPGDFRLSILAFEEIKLPD